MFFEESTDLNLREKDLKHNHWILNVRNCLLLLGFSLFFSVAQGQSLADIQNLKIDDLSDAQLEQMIKRAEANGINSNQLEALARERGMPASEAAKLRQRINDLRNSSKSGNSSTLSSDKGRSLAGEQGPDMFDSLRMADPYYDLTPTQKKIFGYSAARMA